MSSTAPAAHEPTGRTARLLVFFAAMALLAVISRFRALGDRPLHHDESIHAYQSYSLSKGGDWRMSPACAEVSTRSWTSASIRSDEVRPSSATGSPGRSA